MTATGTAQSKDALVGTWKLVSHTTTNDKGEVGHPMGMNPTGFLTYTADGTFSVITAFTGRKPLLVPPPGSIEEKARAFDTFSAYAGSYTFGGDQVIHHVEAAWAQNLVNTDQVRAAKLQGGRLTLRGGFLVNGVVYAANTELVWERMKPKTDEK